MNLDTGNQEWRCSAVIRAGVNSLPSVAVRCWGLMLLGLVLVCSGCAEGMLWRTGNWSPWVQKKWQAEEEMAETLFAQKRQINERVAQAKKSDIASQEKLASELGSIYVNDPVLLAKLEAVRALGQLPCSTTLQILRQASRDPNVDLRLAAVKSIEQMPAEQAIPMLAEVLGADTNLDVRLAATRSLSQFPGAQSAELLRKQLDDRNPALQFTATESLEAVTGQKLGRDIRAWKNLLGPSTVGNYEGVARQPESTAPGGTIAR